MGWESLSKRALLGEVEGVVSCGLGLDGEKEVVLLKGFSEPVNRTSQVLDEIVGSTVLALLLGVVDGGGDVFFSD